MGGQTLGRGDLEPPKRLNLKSGALHKSFGLLTDFCQKCPYWDFRQLWGAPIFGPELPIRPKTSHPDLATVLGGVSPSPSCTDPAPPALYRTLGFSAMNPFDFQVIRCIFFFTTKSRHLLRNGRESRRANFPEQQHGHIVFGNTTTQGTGSQSLK